MIRYTLCQKLPDGTLWRSSEVFDAETTHHVQQAVIAGWLSGEPRWAETETGELIYGLDAKGKVTHGNQT